MRVVRTTGRRSRNIHPRTHQRRTSRQRNITRQTTPEDSAGLATQGEQKKEERGGEVSTCGVAGEDDVFCRNGGVEGAGGRVEEREVGDEGVD